MTGKIVGVMFPRNSTEYHFISYVDVSEGDRVVVDTQNGLAVATVSTANIPGTMKATKEIVAVVDMSAYEERRARKARADELREKMDAKVRELQELAVYEMLSKSDPELASMLDELKGLL